jgi:hypothetical protein
VIVGVTVGEAAIGLSRLVTRLVGRWWVCLLFGLIATAMFTVVVPHGTAVVTASGKLAPRILDEHYPTWRAGDARTLFSGLGPSGRAAYRHFYVSLDFWFPVLSLTVFYSSLLSLAFRKGKWVWVNLLPLVMYVSDMAENVNHFVMAGSYPRLSTLQLTVGPFVSLLKYVLITALPVLALFGFWSARNAQTSKTVRV